MELNYTGNISQNIASYLILSIIFILLTYKATILVHKMEELQQKWPMWPAGPSQERQF